MAAVDSRVGVAPATLRPWDRRLGLGHSPHAGGEHRRHCPHDLAILVAKLMVITAGVAPAEAAQQAKDFKGPISVEHIVDNFEVREDLVEALYAASKLLDKTFVEDALRQDIEKHGVIASWSEVIVPLLFLIGEDWEKTQTGIEVEHLLTEILEGVRRE